MTGQYKTELYPDVWVAFHQPTVGDELKRCKIKSSLVDKGWRDWDVPYFDGMLMELSLLFDGAGYEGSRKSVYDYHYPDPGDIEDVRDFLLLFSDVLKRIWSEFPDHFKGWGPPGNGGVISR